MTSAAGTATSISGEFSEQEAALRDRADPLAAWRSEFLIPPAASIARTAAGSQGAGSAGDPEGASVYLTGNSLGLQPRGVLAAIQQELRDWAELGVEGHLHGAHPWLPYHEELRGAAARLIGAREHEVVVMNSLSVNLHLLMTAFYRPTAARFRIMIEDAAFPSDSHAVASQARLHGLDSKSAVVRLRPRAGEHTLRTEDVLGAIERHGASVALVMLGAVNYLTGQWFDMPAITTATQRAGAIAGWDLAHAAGNVPLALHEIGADFACWCSYKYLNGGPGAIAGAFVHERHTRRDDLLHCAGWWGNDPKTRFAMGPDFVPVHSADRFQLSNPPIFSMTPVRVSLEMFDRAGMPALRAKSRQLTAFLEQGLRGVNERAVQRGGVAPVQVLTPSEPERRGCQLSLVVGPPTRAAHPGPAGDGDATFVRGVHAALTRAGIVVDFRSPNVIRAAPVPMYNTFLDVWRFVAALEAALTGVPSDSGAAA
ncbi:kynureninase [soil metagenome]